MANEIPMTAADVARLEAELEELTTAGRRRVRKDLAKALSFGDFRENAELDEAKRAHSILEGRIADLVQLLGVFTSKYLLIEFVPMDDAWARLPNLSEERWNVELLKEAFGKYFAFEGSWDSYPEGRKLLLFRKTAG